MTIADAMKMIESPEFYATVNAASTYKTFIRLLAAQPAVQELQAVVAQPAIAREIEKRILVLCELPSEDSLEHPADAALAAYLWLFRVSNPELANIAAATVLQCEKCWWARQVAKRTGIASSVPSHTPSERNGETPASENSHSTLQK